MRVITCNYKPAMLSTAILLLFHLVLSDSYAQVRILTLDEAVQAALKNNREVKIARLNVEKADAAVNEAFGYALPSIDASANFSHFIRKPKMPFPDFQSLLSNATYNILFDEKILPRDDNKFKPVKSSLQSFVQANSYETKLQITQTLFNSAVFRGIGASKIYLALSQEDLKNAVSNTVLNVKKNFYGVLLNKKMLEITKASYNNAQKNLENVQALYKEGLVSEFDVLQAEVRTENIHPHVLQMENILKNLIDALKIVLGINQKEKIDVTGKLLYEKEDFPDIESSIEEALISNFSIKSLTIKLQVDEEFIYLDKAEYWPTLYAFGNYTYSGTSDKFTFQNYSSAIVGLTFSINLFSGGQTKNRVEQSQLALQQSKEQLLQYRDFIISEVKAKHNDLKRVEDIIAAQDRNVNLAEKAYRISLVRYKEGTGNQLEVENSDLALRQARINKLQSIYDYIIAKSNLKQLLGRIDSNYMDSFNVR